MKNLANATNLEIINIAMKYFLLSFLALVSLPIASETVEPFTGSNKTELREISLGMHVKDIPDNRFKNYSCASDSKELNNLTDFEQCSSDGHGLYEVGLQYDTSENEWAKINDKLAGTTIGGHPVILSIMITKQGLVQGIRAYTDPDARTYLKRQAYLLSKRVKSHYGTVNWECIDKEPGDGGNKKFGPVFIDQHCIKTFDDKKIVVESKFYRAPNQTGKEHTNSSTLEIFSLVPIPD